MTTTTTKSIIAAAGFAVAALAMAGHSDEAKALPAIKLTTPTVEAGVVVNVGWRRRAVRRAFRWHVRRPYYAARRCHFHWVTVPGGGVRKVWHCAHRH